MRILFPLIILVLIALACSAPSNAPKQTTGVFALENKANFEKQLLIALGKFPAKWNTIEVSKFEQNAVTIYLNYKNDPASISEVEKDTNRIAQAALNSLKSQGYDPFQNWLALFVHAQKPERGATGKSLIRAYGKTMYDFSNDTLKFEERKGLF